MTAGMGGAYPSSEDSEGLGEAFSSRSVSAESLRPRCENAGLPWIGLDGSWSGERCLGSLYTGADGVVEYGVLVHGDPPSRRPNTASPRRFANVITMARLARRVLGGSDHPIGHVEATTESTVAAVAGVGLLADDWPWRIDRTLRQDWLYQQTEIAYELADRLDAAPWRSLALPVDGSETKFHYRESDYGWVLTGETPVCWLGAYGRGISAYGLGFAVLADLDGYADPRD